MLLSKSYCGLSQTKRFGVIDDIYGNSKLFLQQTFKIYILKLWDIGHFQSNPIWQDLPWHRQPYGAKAEFFVGIGQFIQLLEKMRLGCGNPLKVSDFIVS